MSNQQEPGDLHVQSGAVDAPVAPDLGRFKVKRNLHFWIIGGVVTMLTIFMLGESLQEEHKDEAAVERQEQEKQKKLAAQNKTDMAPSPELFSQMISKQEKEAMDAAAARSQASPATTPFPGQNPMPSVPDGLPPIPSRAGVPDLGLPKPEDMKARSTANKDASEEERLAAKREDQITSAPIFAIDGKGRLSTQQVSKRNGADDEGSPLLQIDKMRQEQNASTEQRMNASRQERDEMFNRAMNTAGQMAGGQKQQHGAVADRGWLDSKEATGAQTPEVLRPRASPGEFALMQGAVVPAVLVSEIRSDLPGQIKAQVSMDVYDSQGRGVLLIPKGSMLVGQYNSEVRMGQEKVLAAFQRLIYPSGASVNLNGMGAAEASGSSGLGDDVDNHFFKMFATNFMVAGLAQFFAKDAGTTTVNNNGTTTGLQSTAGQILADTVKVINQRNGNIPPTIYVYRGHKFNVMVNKDMVLSPYLTGAGR